MLNSLSKFKTISLNGVVVVSEKETQVTITDETITCSSPVGTEGNSSITVTINRVAKTFNINYNNVKNMDAANVMCEAIIEELELVVLEIDSI